MLHAVLWNWHNRPAVTSSSSLNFVASESRSLAIVLSSSLPYKGVMHLSGICLLQTVFTHSSYARLFSQLVFAFDNDVSRADWYEATIFAKIKSAFSTALSRSPSNAVRISDVKLSQPEACALHDAKTRSKLAFSLQAR